MSRVSGTRLGATDHGSYESIVVLALLPSALLSLLAALLLNEDETAAYPALLVHGRSVPASSLVRIWWRAKAKSC
jgi:hypothetical protein